MLLGLGDAQRQSGVGAYRETLLEAANLANEAVAIARRSGDPLVLLESLRLCEGGIACVDNASQRLAWSDEACTIADALGDPVHRFNAHGGRANVAIEMGDGDAMRFHLTVRKETAALVPHASIGWTHAFSWVLQSILAGDLADAERRADAALALGIESDQPDPMGVYAGQLVNIRHHQGRLAELVPLIEQVLIDSPRLPVYRAVLAMACAHAGDRDRAQSLLAEGHRDGFAASMDGSWATSVSVWGIAAVRLGDLAAAQVLRGLLAPYSDRIPFTGISIMPVIGHYLGTLDHLLGRCDEASRWFADAMAVHERMGSPLLISCTQAAWSSVLADLGATDRARSLAAAAVSSAVDGGFGYIESDARSVLARLA